MNFTKRVEILELFKVLARRVYNEDISKWLFESWKSAEPWHFELADHLKSCNVKNTFKILKLALILQPVEIILFSNYAAKFANMDSCNMIIDYIER